MVYNKIAGDEMTPPEDKAPDMPDVVPEVLGIYLRRRSDDREINIKISMLMLGAVFAVMEQNIHKADCIELVEGAMKKSGWTE